MQKYDLAIIGGGLAGLSSALEAHNNGMKVVILEKRALGQNASSGIVGALAPHMPENWNAKKQYQLDSLHMSPEYWKNIEDISGIETNYKKRGRLQIIIDERGVEKAKLREHAAEISWKDQGRWHYLNDDKHPFKDAPLGYIYDTLSSQIYPQNAMRALTRTASKLGIPIYENFEVLDFVHQHIIGRDVIRSDKILIAAGFESWPWLRRYLGANFGEGVKGQAALLRTGKPWNFPMVTGDGFYIVPHESNLIGVGSTNERYWKNDRIDTNLDELLARVFSLCPELANAQIISKWSGIRPRAYRPDPLIGEIEKDIYVNCGGFKTGFSFMPKLAKDLQKIIQGEHVEMPKGFLVNASADT